jgi:uncharacterized protein
MHVHPGLNDVFIVPHRERYLLHAPLHGVTSLLNPSAAAEMRRFLVSGSPAGLAPRTRALAEELLARNGSPPAVPAGPFAPHQVSLLPTNDCNMRCLYCAPGAGSHDVTYMSREIADAALSYQATIVERNGYRSLMVYLFGGEPFVAWDLVQYCGARAVELAGKMSRPAWLACTTNAFMSPQRARWVAKHFAFVLVSLDGPAELHDHYRPSRGGGVTHRVVTRNLGIFDGEGLPYALRCSVDDRIVRRLPEIVEYFCRSFHPVAINLEPLILHGRSLETGLQSPSPSAFVNGVVAAGPVARAYRVGLKLTTAQTERIAQSNCAIAEDSFVVAPDGLVSACYGANHRGSEIAPDYAIGEVDPVSLTVHIDQARVDHVRTFAVANIPRCRSCFCKWHCSGGCRLFHTPPYSTEAPGPMCLVTQKLTLWRILDQLQLHDEADSVRLDPEELADACA